MNTKVLTILTILFFPLLVRPCENKNWVDKSENQILFSLENKKKELSHQQDELDCVLRFCMKQGFSRAVKYLLNNFVINISLEDSFGFTPLMEAVELRNVEFAKLLLERGADPNQKKIPCNISTNGTRFGISPFEVAILANDLSMVELLLAHGADPNLQHCSELYLGSLPVIFLSISSGNPTIVSALIRSGANINTKCVNSFGCFTPIYVSYSQKYDEVYDVLTQYGARISKKNQEQAEFIRSVLSGDKEHMQLLYKPEFKHLRTIEGKTPVILAIESGNDLLVKEFLRMDFDVNITDTFGRSPGVYALKKGNPKIVETVFYSKSFFLDYNYLGESYLSLARKLRSKPAIIEIVEKRSVNEK